MVDRIVGRGTARIFRGAHLPMGQTLTIQGGDTPGGPGGTAILTGNASNAGTILIQSGAYSSTQGQLGGQGGLLEVVGTLTSTGSIAAYGSGSDIAPGQGGTLLVAGTLDNAGAISAYGGAEAGVLLDQGTLANTGTISLYGGPSEYYATHGGSLSVIGVLANSGQIFASGGGGGYGGASGGGGAAIAVSGQLQNAGLLDLAGGYGGTNGGGGGGVTLDVASGGLLSNAGSLLIAGGRGGGDYGNGGTGAVAEVAGTLVNAAAARLEIGGGDGTASFGGTGGAGGTLALTQIDQGARILSGTLLNAGTLVVDGGAAAYASGAAAYAGGGGALIDGGVIVNNGTMELMAGAAGTRGAAGGGGASLAIQTYSRLVDAGVLTIDAASGNGQAASLTNGADVLVTGGSAVAGNYPAGPGGMLVDAGTVTNAGYFGVIGGMGGAVAGASAFAGGQVQVTGLFTSGAGASLTLGGGGSTAVKGAVGGQGGTLSVAGILLNAGLIEAQAGFAARSGTGSGAGAVILDSGTITNPGSVFLLAGTAGEKDANKADHPGAQLIDSNLLDNFGTITVSGPADGYVGAELTITNTGTLIEESGSVLTGTGLINNMGTIVVNGVLAAGVLVNDGTVQIHAGTATIDAAIRSDTGSGSFAVASGATLALADAVSGNESVTLAAGATLEANAASAGIRIDAAAGATLDLGGGTATLNAADTNLVVRLDSATDLTLAGLGFLTLEASHGADTFRGTAADFAHATLNGLAAGDRIDLTDLAYAPGLALGWTQTGNDGQLSVGSAHLDLGGSFAASDFAAASDGHGGVLITLHT